MKKWKWRRDKKNIHFEKDKIYLVEKYVNKHMRDYECSCEEEEINKILKDYYTFFKENYEEIHVWKG